MAHPLSTEERAKRNDEKVQVALVAGAKSAVLAALACGTVHAVGTTFVPPYRKLDPYIKRIFAAILILGSYSVTSQVEAAHIVERQFKADAEAIQARDRQRFREMNAAAEALSAAGRRKTEEEWDARNIGEQQAAMH